MESFTPGTVGVCRRGRREGTDDRPVREGRYAHRPSTKTPPVHRSTVRPHPVYPRLGVKGLQTQIFLPVDPSDIGVPRKTFRPGRSLCVQGTDRAGPTLVIGNRKFCNECFSLGPDQTEIFISVPGPRPPAPPTHGSKTCPRRDEQWTSTTPGPSVELARAGVGGVDTPSDPSPDNMVRRHPTYSTPKPVDPPSTTASVFCQTTPRTLFCG